MKKIAISLFLILLIISSLGYVFIKKLNFRLNTTESIPLGIYQLEKSNKEIKKGDFIVFCLPQELHKTAFYLGYVGDGNCYNKYEPLAKEVVGVQGDFVTTKNNEVFINNKLLKDYRIRKFDSLGRPVKSINYDNKKLDGYFVLGSLDKERSWDSRYYGEIEKENVIGVLKPILIWG